MPRIIGLWAPMSAGKSTVASLLVERHDFVEFSFAGPLKSLAKDIFAFDDSVLYGPSSSRNAVDSRGAYSAYWDQVWDRAFQEHWYRVVELFDSELYRSQFGKPFSEIRTGLNNVLRNLKALRTDFTPRAALQQLGTDFGRAIWDQVWVQAAMRSIDESGAKRVVFSDARFPNEAQPIIARGGDVWWIDSSKRVPRSPFRHASESTYEEAAPYVTHILDNNGTTADLAERVAVMIADP